MELVKLIETVPSFLDILKVINSVIMTALGIFYINQIFYLIMSVFFSKRKYKDARKNHCYGFIIAARNEEAVIGDLIDSIHKQNYSNELMHIFVVADNCTDNTARIARSKGAIVFERFDETFKGKSYALNFAFKKIFKEYDNLNIEAFFIFDADNLLDVNFVKEINKAYDANNKVITGFRAPKNFSDSWISGGAAYMYLRESRQVHRVRANMRTSTYVSGTGYLVDREIIEKDNGWIYNTLVEDIELSTTIITKNKKIAFCEDALFFDEQPSSLKDSFNQRLRWSKGNHQVFFKEGFKLFKSMLKRFSFSKWGMFVHILPMPALSFIWVLLFLIIGTVYYFVSGVDFWNYFDNCLYIGLKDLIFPTFLTLLSGFIVMIQCWKLLSGSWFKKIFYMIMFPVYMAIFLPITAIALFIKVSWKEIKHGKK